MTTDSISSLHSRFDAILQKAE
jgi:prolyl-tRNA editing enzyme YbaK/EbsC (Cys-tRNA(Pro) deacylase)